MSVVQRTHAPRAAFRHAGSRSYFLCTLAPSFSPRARPSPSPTHAMDDLRFPVGKFNRPASLTPDQRRAAIDAVVAAPKHLRAAVRGLDDAKLDTPYRTDGWTVRQVVHHVPDS